MFLTLQSNLRILRKKKRRMYEVQCLKKTSSFQSKKGSHQYKQSKHLEMSQQSKNSSNPLRRSPRKHVTTSNSAGPNILKDNVGLFRQLPRSASKLGDGGVNFKEMSSKRKYKYFLFVYICVYIQGFQQVLRMCHWGLFRCPLGGARQNLIGVA